MFLAKKVSMIFSAFVFVVLMKIVFFVYVYLTGLMSFGGNNDADVYHAFATGFRDKVTSSWPVMLRALNEAGLYSRTGLSFIIMASGWLVVPYLVAKVSIDELDSTPIRRWLIALGIALYPTLFYYTMDIYREVIMLLVFLLGLHGVRAALRETTWVGAVKYLGFIFMAVGALCTLRPYLGISFLVAYMGMTFYDLKRWPLWTSVAVYVVLLNVGFWAGLFDSLMKYRLLFVQVFDGGSNLGLQFDTLTFIPVLIQSFFIQMLGVYFSSVMGGLLFFVESVPFMACLVYVVLNRRYATPFVSFLFLFFVLYGTVWLLGNDNLGTAVRLRIFNYIALFAAAATLYFSKQRNRAEQAMKLRVSEAVGTGHLGC
jgi:hypothetical protein